MRTSTQIQVATQPLVCWRFSELAAVARRDYGLKKKDIATALGVKPGTLSQWGQSAQLPSLNNAAEILGICCTLFRCDISELVYLSTIPKRGK